ncbi:DUF2637 domain-containing protein [Streptomyces abikoensis]|uniref:DUF2637 domain-containing protein n=1 Tax=Streptomyces abikoensis TaxID=97398 RepID=UPI0033C91267
MNHTSHTTTPVGGWDRAAILTLGAAGCALSYDALQQMAVAIHIRGLLTYLYPLVIDGFIGYGVRALILTRTAPWRARLYVWSLFGTATTASIWANALHAVRLNALHHAGSGLRLGDITVGILSTLAPLALAGAVHLYILITRHQPARSGTVRGPVRADQPAPGDRSAEPVRTPEAAFTSGTVRNETTACTDRRTADADRPADQSRTAGGPQNTVRTGPHQDEGSGQPSGPVRTPRATTADQSAKTVRPLSGPHAEASGSPLPQAPASPEDLAADREQARPHPQELETETSGPVYRTGHADRSAPATVPTPGPQAADPTAPGPSPEVTDRSAADQQTTPSGAVDAVRTSPQGGVYQRTADAADRQNADRSATGGESEEQDIEELLPIARAAIEHHGRINRTVVRSGLREHQIQVSNQRLGLILQRLREEAALAT